MLSIPASHPSGGFRRQIGFPANLFKFSQRDPQCRDCSCNPTAFPPSMEVRCGKCRFRKEHEPARQAGWIGVLKHGVIVSRALNARCYSEVIFRSPKRLDRCRNSYPGLIKMAAVSHSPPPLSLSPTRDRSGRDYSMIGLAVVHIAQPVPRSVDFHVHLERMRPME